MAVPQFSVGHWGEPENEADTGGREDLEMRLTLPSLPDFRTPSLI